MKKAVLALLAEPSQEFRGKTLPQYQVRVDGNQDSPSVENQRGSWAWLKVSLEVGDHRVQISFTLPESDQTQPSRWEGRHSMWARDEEEVDDTHLLCELKQPISGDKPQLSRLWPPVVSKVSYYLGQVKLGSGK